MFWVIFLIFYFSYLFSVLFLGLLVCIVILVWFSSLIYVKFLVVLVYISGVVVFMLYISCLCWNVIQKFNFIFLALGLFIVYIFDIGLYSKFSDIGEFLWIYLFFAFLFNRLISGYSLNLFKVSGSLRF